jgi:hypothetical protein
MMQNGETYLLAQPVEHTCQPILYQRLYELAAMIYREVVSLFASSHACMLPYTIRDSNSV